MIGPPGSGKTMLAKCMPTILPPLSFEDALETAKIHSVAGVLDAASGWVGTHPFRSPHHTISDAGLIGGGMIPRPGEVSLAHNGVLFLEELPEFPCNVLEVTRQPLEDGTMTIARAAMSLSFLARFMVLAAMNPPCGYFQRPHPRVPLHSQDHRAVHFQDFRSVARSDRYSHRRPSGEFSRVAEVRRPRRVPPTSGREFCAPVQSNSTDSPLGQSAFTQMPRARQRTKACVFSVSAGFGLARAGVQPGPSCVLKGAQLVEPLRVKNDSNISRKLASKS